MNGSRISAEEMWEELSKALTKAMPALRDNWTVNKSFTKTMTRLLEDLGKQLGFVSDLEYWPRVDVSYFSQETKTIFEHWSREVAIEIENDSTRWTEELDKLFAINAGLKVLITYEDGSEEDLFGMLADQSKNSVLSVYRSRKYLTAGDSYLLVFGPTSLVDSERKSYAAFEMTASGVRALPPAVSVVS